MGETLYAIFKDGKPTNEQGYATLIGACAALRDSPQGCVVVSVDALWKPIREFGDEECRRALNGVKTD